METFEFVVKNSFALIKLREYINNPASFNCKRDNTDTYIVKDIDIDIWLQEDYPFAFDFLCKAEENNYNVIPLLNDIFFGLYFTDTLDLALYSQKLQEEQNRKGESEYEH